MSDEYAGKRVVVMGLGRFGGGAGAVKWLARQGAKLLVTDLSPAEKLAESIAEIQSEIDSGVVELRLGAHDIADFRDADVVVVSPAVPKPWENTFLLAAKESGAKLTTEIRLLVEHLPNRDRTIGVTGTAGKSTTTAMVAHMLRVLACAQSPKRKRGVSVAPNDGRDARPTDECDFSRVWLGGNIGGSLLPRIGEIEANDWVVLELSSAQLYWLSDWFAGRREENGWSPHVAVVTNVMPNHLNWHGDFEHYEQCKRSIAAYQSESDTAILADRMVCGDAQEHVAIRSAAKAIDGAEHIAESLGTLDEIWPEFMHQSRQMAAGTFELLGEPKDFSLFQSLPVKGQHNWQNASIACLAASFASPAHSHASRPRTREEIHAWVDEHFGKSDSFIDALRTFTGLPHRLQHVGDAHRDGGVIHAYNDSKCTTPEAAALAVQAFADDERVGAGRVHLIAGGYDKGVDLTPLVRASVNCKAVYTIGATGPRIASAVTKQGGRAVGREILDRAVEAAVEAATPGDVILLSPGCASWDQFTNYEERGERFTQLVRARLGLEPAPRSLFEMPGEV